MNEPFYPSLPYMIRIQTKAAIVWMLWQETAWDTPAPVTYNTDYEPAAATIKEYLTVAHGFQGYLIEDVDRCAPMDVHAALVASKESFILGFDLIGMIPDPPSSPDEDIEPDDDEEEAPDTIDEPPVEPVLESIPADMQIKVPFILEGTNETVFVEQNAQSTLDDIGKEIAGYDTVLKRMES